LAFENCRIADLSSRVPPSRKVLSDSYELYGYRLGSGEVVRVAFADGSSMDVSLRF
jgi:hypothetical protein